MDTTHGCHCWHCLQDEERQMQRELDAAQRRVHEALCDNINTQVWWRRWWRGQCVCPLG